MRKPQRRTTSQPTPSNQPVFNRRTFVRTGVAAGLAGPALLAATQQSAAAAEPSTYRSVVDFHTSGSDWTSAIQDAIDDANPTNNRHGGGIVYIPAGKYSVRGNIKVHTGVTVQGDGWGSFIQLASGANAPIFNVDETTGADGRPAFATSILSLRLNGNRNKQSQAVPIIRIATGSGTTPIFNDHRHTIADLFLQYGSGHGIEIVGTRATRVDNVYVTKCASSGISVTDSSDGLFTRVVSAGNNVGFSLAGASNNLLACRASRNTSDGFAMSSSRMAITNGYSLDNGRDGYRVEGSEANLTGCIADSNRDAGLRIAGAKRASVNGLSSYSRVSQNTNTAPFYQRWGVLFENTDHNFVSGLVRQNQTDLQGTNTGGVTQLVVG